MYAMCCAFAMLALEHLQCLCSAVSSHTHKHTRRGYGVNAKISIAIAPATSSTCCICIFVQRVLLDRAYSLNAAQHTQCSQIILMKSTKNFVTIALSTMIFITIFFLSVSFAFSPSNLPNLYSLISSLLSQFTLWSYMCDCGVES